MHSHPDRPHTPTFGEVTVKRALSRIYRTNADYRAARLTKAHRIAPCEPILTQRSASNVHSHGSHGVRLTLSAPDDGRTPAFRGGHRARSRSPVVRALSKCVIGGG